MPKLILSVNNFDRVARHAVRLLEFGRTKVSKNIPLVGSALNELKRIYCEVDAMLTEVSGDLPEFGIDIHIIWDILETKLPSLEKNLQRILEDMAD